MLKRYLKDLCSLFAPSGDECAVRAYIVENLPEYAEYKVDPLGSLLVTVNGLKKANNSVMLDAHMDEVGIIVSGITPNGFLRFKTVGGIDTAVLIARKVRFLNGTIGVICVKPVHLLDDNERDTLPDAENLYIDIGAKDASEANKLVKAGDTATFDTPFCVNDDGIITAKALDDRAGCAVLLTLINSFNDFSYTVSFTVQEEVGLRGAKTAAYAINPDFAVVVESTTAADIDGVAAERRVCSVSNGAVISYMDSATFYSKKLFALTNAVAENSGIKHQVKQLPTGGNNAGAIHLSRCGVPTVSLSVPCRYIHSPSSVADIEDIAEVYRLALEMLKTLAFLPKND